MLCLVAFLGSRLPRTQALTCRCLYFLASALPVDLPAGFCTFAIIRAIPSARRGFAPPSPHHHQKGLRIFDRMAIGGPLRESLRSRLTLIRLALIRNPWSFGGRVSRPPYRYLFLHLLLRPLQQGSRLTFNDDRNAPLPINLYD